MLSRETEALPSKYYGQRLEFRGGWPHNCIVCLLKKFRISGNEISFFLSRNSTTFCRQCVSKFDIFVNVFELWISNHIQLRGLKITYNENEESGSALWKNLQNNLVTPYSVFKRKQTKFSVCKFLWNDTGNDQHSTFNRNHSKLKIKNTTIKAKDFVMEEREKNQRQKMKAIAVKCNQKKTSSKLFRKLNATCEINGWRYVTIKTY